MFIKVAERNFADIEKLTDDLITPQQRRKDVRLPRAGIKLRDSQLTLTGVLVVVAFAGIVFCF